MTPSLQPGEPSPGQRHWLRGTWRLCDPKISLASIASMFLGICISLYLGSPDWWAFTLTVVGILVLEAAKNASGEVVDLDSGTDLMIADADRSPFSGGKRVIVDGLLTRRQTGVLSAALYLAGIATGLWIVVAIEPLVFGFGLAGVMLAFFYHAPPVRLAYRGWGELAVAVTYGPLICCGTCVVQLGRVPAEALLLSIPLGLMVGAFLVINEFPDRRADAAAGKRNLVVRLGVARAKRLHQVVIIAAFLTLAPLPWAGLPMAVWLGFAGLPVALASTRRLHAATTTTEVIPAQAMALIAFLLMALGSGIGLVI